MSEGTAMMSPRVTAISPAVWSAKGRRQPAATLPLRRSLLQFPRARSARILRRRSGGACPATAAIRLRHAGSPSGHGLIGVGDSQSSERPYLTRLHVRGIDIFEMVVAEQVERAVDDQMRRMLLHADALFGSLGCAGAVREDNVAKQKFRSGNIC